MDEDKIQQEIAKTLALTDDAPRASAGPFFYTRLRARMSTEQGARGPFARAVRNRVLVAAAGLSLLILINIYSFFHLSARSTEAQKAQTLASFAQEYHLSSSTY
jgi:hypothetical protein